MIYGAGNDIFRDIDGKFTFVNDWHDWENRLPEVGFYQASQIDKAIGWAWPSDLVDAVGAPNSQGQVNLGGVEAMLQELGGRNVVSAIREATGTLAVTVGFLRGVRTSLSRLYEDPLKEAANYLDYFNEIINSDYFQQALDGLTMIPIVGWILRIVGEILRLVADISAAVAAAKQQQMDTALGARFYLPMYGPQEQHAHETAEMQNLLRALDGYGATNIFRPRYIARSAADLEARRARYEGTVYRWNDSQGNPHETAVQDAFYITSSKGGGGGFIPGASSLLTTIEIRNGGCGTGWIRNIGDYLATVQATAGYVWQTILSPGPPMYSVDTRNWIIDEWVDTMHSWIVYAVESVSRGWTCSETASPPVWLPDKNRWSGGDWEYCGPWNRGKTDCKRTKHYGRKINLPSGVSHASELIDWLSRKYWGRGPRQDQFPVPAREGGGCSENKHLADCFIYDNAVPVVALRNLRERQRAKLLSLDSFYVHPQKVEDTDQYRFAAFADPELRDEWAQAITVMLNQSDDWRNVYMPDVPKDSPVRQILLDRGVPADPPAHQGPTQIAGATVLGDPEPPEPPEQAGMMELVPLPGAGGGKKKKKKKSDTGAKVAKVAVGAAATGAVLYALKRRGKTFSLPKIGS